MSKPLRYGTFASGICAPSVAWRRLGWKPVFFSEIAKFASSVLKYHYPDVPNIGDMNHAHQNEVFQNEPVDVICAGTPCQSYSLAGLRAGMASPNGNLALVFLELLSISRPTWVVWENVPGVMSSWSDAETSSARNRPGVSDIWQTNDFDTFLCGLQEIGYGVAYRVFDAAHFGVPQQRERVFVVGHIGGQWQRAAAVLFDSESLRRHPAKVPKARSVVAPITASGARKGGTYEQPDQLVVMPPDAQSRAAMIPGQSPTLARDHQGPILFKVREGVEGGGKGYIEKDGAFALATIPDQFVFQPAVEVAPTLTAGTYNQGPGTNPDSAESLVLAFHSKQSASRDMNPSDMVPTLGKNSAKGAAVFSMRNGYQSEVAQTVCAGGKGVSANTVPHTLAPAGIRRLTPRECERLMESPGNCIRYECSPLAFSERLVLRRAWVSSVTKSLSFFTR